MLLGGNGEGGGSRFLYKSAPLPYLAAQCDRTSHAPKACLASCMPNQICHTHDLCKAYTQCLRVYIRLQSVHPFPLEQCVSGSCWLTGFLVSLLMFSLRLCSSFTTQDPWCVCMNAFRGIHSIGFTFNKGDFAIYTRELLSTSLSRVTVFNAYWENCHAERTVIQQ